MPLRIGTPEQEQEARDLYKLGYTQRALSEMYGVSYRTIQRWIHPEHRKWDIAHSKAHTKPRVRRKYSARPMGRGPRQNEVRAILAEGPNYFNVIQGRTGLHSQQVSLILRKGIKQGWIKRISTGYYSLISDQTPRVSDLGGTKHAR